MRSNNTQFRKFNAGPPKGGAININRKRFSSDLSADYKIVLQLYCLTKEQVAMKKKLTFEKPSSVISGRVISKPSYPVISTIVSFFTVNFSFNKKVRQEIALVAE